LVSNRGECFEIAWSIRSCQTAAASGAATIAAAASRIPDSSGTAVGSSVGAVVLAERDPVVTEGSLAIVALDVAAVAFWNETPIRRPRL
jgi:hypothetical protein